MFNQTDNSPWFCIRFKMKQLKRERQKKNQLKKVSSITPKRFVLKDCKSLFKLL